MPSDRMFKKALFGLAEDEVLDYMDRLLAVIERQKSGSERGREFLICQMREDLALEAGRLRRERMIRRLLFAVCPILLALAVFGVTCRWYGIAEVTGDSMSPALRTGDLVIYSRRKEPYNRGDLVVCDVENTRIVKRAAGIPGDCVKLDGDGRVRIESGGGQGHGKNPGGPPLQISLGSDEYFLLGDNRDLSVDSRDVRIGPVKWEHIEGRVLFMIRAIGKRGEQ